MPLISAPAIRVIAPDTKRLQQGFQVQKGLILTLTKSIGYTVPLRWSTACHSQRGVVLLPTKLYISSTSASSPRLRITTDSFIYHHLNNQGPIYSLPSIKLTGKTSTTKISKSSISSSHHRTSPSAWESAGYRPFNWRQHKSYDASSTTGGTLLQGKLAPNP